MAGIINLITQHSSKLSILPIIVLMNLILSILLHFLSKKKLSKFIPSLVLGIGALLLLIYSLGKFTTTKGLDLTWIAVFLGTSALVGIFTCFIIDLIASIKISSQNIDYTKNKTTKKTRTSKAKKISKPKNKSRVARKPKKNKSQKKKASKFHTKKIKAGSVKASKKEKLNDKNILTFES